MKRRLSRSAPAATLAPIPIERYNTNIITTNRIVTFSDIHADIHALIICLRDCAKVIRKKDGFEFNQLCPDDDLEALLNIDISDNDGYYKDDLNYEWIGEDTYVVIVGDMLDGYRSITKDISKIKGHEQHEYDQVEIKILRFINALNKLAISHNSKIFKLLGNHELKNILDVDFPLQYVPPYTLYVNGVDGKLKDYYRGYDRTKVFSVGNPGYKLLFEDGIGLLLKINNNIFVHATIEHKNFGIYEEINLRINNPNIDSITFNSIMLNISKQSQQLNGNGELWNRTWGDDKNIYERFKDTVNNKGKIMCDDVLNKIRRFLSDVPEPKPNAEDMRIIIGHCPQYHSSNMYIHITDSTGTTLGYEKPLNRTFTNLIDNDPIIETYTPPAVTGEYDIEQKLIFGITMECSHENNINDHLLYRVDVGVSRAFDFIGSEDESSTSIRNYIKNYYSRTPQILEINRNDIKIIKSNIINTRKHQPRPFLEDKIKNYNNPNLNTLDIGINKCVRPLSHLPRKKRRHIGGFYNKYQKYIHKLNNITK